MEDEGLWLRAFATAITTMTTTLMTVFVCVCNDLYKYVGGCCGARVWGCLQPVTTGVFLTLFQAGSKICFSLYFDFVFDLGLFCVYLHTTIRCRCVREAKGGKARNTIKRFKETWREVVGVEGCNSHKAVWRE